VAFLTRCRQRLALLRRSSERPSDVDGELAHWVDELTRRFEAKGLSPAEARRQALIETGGVTQVKEAVHDVRTSSLHWILDDLRHAVRVLWFRPRFTLPAVVVLTLGVGAGTAVFSFVNAVLLEPLPYKNLDRLTLLWCTTPRTNQLPLSYTDVTDWKERTNAFERIAAVGVGFFTLAGADTPEQLIAARVSPELFDMLGASAALGRTLRVGDDAAGSERVVVLGHELWEKHFGGRNDVVGRQITLNDQTYTVVGTMPRSFWFLSKDFQAWVPFQPTPQQRQNRAAHSLFAAGLLRPGVTTQVAQDEVSVVAAQNARAYPASNDGIGSRVSSVTDEMLQTVRPTLSALSGAVFFMLLLAYTNLANLVLAHIGGREREIAIRVALGGRRSRIVGLFVTEAALIAAIAGTLGVLFARLCISMFASLFPTSLPIPVPGLENVRIDAATFAFAFLTSLLTAVAVSGLTVLAAAQSNPAVALRNGDATLAGGTSPRYRRMLLATTEIALAVVLLIGAGLMVKSFVQLQRTSLGFTPAQILTMNTPLPRFRYPDAQQRVLFYERTLDQLRGLASVRYVGLVNVLPLSGIAGQVAVRVLGAAGSPGAMLSALSRAADDEYFRAMRIPLRRGRLFAAADRAGAPPVAVVSESMARRLWPSADALSQTFLLGENPAPLQVIGVVGDVRHWIGAEPEPTFYRPYRQAAPDSAAFVVQTAGPPMAVASAAEQVIWSTDRDQPITYVRTFDTDIADQMWPQRLSAAALGMFAIVALAVAATGVFGVMSASVGQRSREIGIRVAIGADPPGIVRMVLSEAAGWIALGIGIGVAASVALGRYLRSVLYGVTATDPSTFGVIVALTAVTAILATYFPARRASRRAPMEMLNR